MPSAKIVKAASAPPREHVEQAEKSRPAATEQLRRAGSDRCPVPNVRADPEHDHANSRNVRRFFRSPYLPVLAELRGRGGHLRFAAFLALWPRPSGFALVLPLALVFRAVFAS